ncbi:MAG: UDP-N-acetyl-D-glucosamine 2-epimerase, UDP-hydrolysing [Sphingobacteriales bacterium 50-39]|nr:UDP-N-acetylglucosamine 2-epimerase (hydrolyzing) [Sphingobacteriales bacterium]OJW56835.1 MAG: UDP-N-acetyl-D-glucosamine 2-epimerase, UDP-hydrolysing [Sphingobacteriales bacterium 50-39]
MKGPRLKICIVTGSRAEYGLLYPLMRLIRKESSMDLQLLVTGMHLSPEFGLTFRQIEADGFSIQEKVEMLLSGDTDTAMIKATGLGMIGFADAFHRLQPDWVVVLGDRFETFAAATAAHLAKIPIAHLHGGELTEGATDDAMRHAITKMAFLHFTSAEPYRKRVIQLGESPRRVFNVGAIGLDNIKGLKLLSKRELQKELDFPVGDKTVLVTYHPTTLEKDTATRQVGHLLKALDQFPDIRILFTLPNADAGGRSIIQQIEEYVKKNRERARAFTSLGQLKYLSALQYVSAVVGNSSSGVLEAPYFGIPTVNIGDRQTGRLKPPSVIDTGTDVRSITEGIRKAFLPSFVKLSKRPSYVYGKGDTAPKILRIIQRTGKPASVKKTFHDLT